MWDEHALHGDSCRDVSVAQVYDVTNFHKKHPGGPGVLLQMGGKDATAAAAAAHKSILPANLMWEFCIGYIVSQSKDKVKSEVKRASADAARDAQQAEGRVDGVALLCKMQAFLQDVLQKQKSNNSVQVSKQLETRLESLRLYASAVQAEGREEESPEAAAFSALCSCTTPDLFAQACESPDVKPERSFTTIMEEMDSEILPLSDDALAAPESSSQIRKGSQRDLERESGRPSKVEMPEDKVVTSRRLPVYTNKGQKEDDRFNAFHCKRCRTHLVTTDADLANIPRRRTDGAMVLDARLQVISLYTVKREGSRVIRREKGAERQYVHACPSCDQDVGYTSKPHEADLELVYLSDTAVTVPWHRMKSPFTCKVCGYICQSQGQLEFHRKQKQHTEEMEKEQEAANELKPIIVGCMTGATQPQAFERQMIDAPVDMAAISTLVPPVAAWVLVSKEGFVVRASPSAVETGSQKAALLKHIAEDKTPPFLQDLYGGNALVLQFTPDDETFFNTTLSVLREGDCDADDSDSSRDNDDNSDQDEELPEDGEDSQKDDGYDGGADKDVAEEQYDGCYAMMMVMMMTIC
ncbi:unnamed protein product [Symbiodinium necroappetens]|uniref:C2H2-type domain-containing protein n=1 Tax=Symbiodinium necroappetens TaxID=1628268 RepID=A0A812LRT6_9DINO|nr:unnamed protein product [Symbiodinium necroappetens]